MLSYYHATSTLRPSFLIEAESAEVAQTNADNLAIEGEAIRVARRPVDCVADEAEAVRLFWERNEELDYVDNVRKAYADRPAEMASYENQRNDGCCGFIDETYLVSGRLFHMGCNYGH